MIVHCPHCSTGYTLPDHMLGARGARVRCPGCREAFLVLRGPGADEIRIESAGISDAMPPSGTPSPPEPPPVLPAEEPAAIASELSPPSMVAEAAAPAPVEAAPPASFAAPAPVESAPAFEVPPIVSEATTAPPPAPPDDPAGLADYLLDQLTARLGGALDDARGRGKVLAEHGPELMAAFDDYRRSLGSRANVSVFRSAVQKRWGVDLTPPNDTAAHLR